MVSIIQQDVPKTFEENCSAIYKTIEAVKAQGANNLILSVEKITPADLVELTNHLRKNGYRVHSFYGMTMIEIVW